jgi:transposase
VLGRRAVAEPDELAYSLVFVPSGTPLANVVRVAGRRWSIEEAIAEAKGEVGLDALAAEVGDARVGLVLDNSGSHRSRLLQWPERIVPLPLPPYTPELNPAERVFQVVRTALANRIFDDLDALDAALAEALAPYWQEPVRLQWLTGYSWWLAGVERLSPMLPSAS